MRIWPVITLTAALVMLAPMAPAHGAVATFRASPASGPPGTSIALSSVTPCTLPAGVTGAPFISVTLTRGNTVVAAARIPVSPGGSWSGTLAVGKLAAPGTDTIEAFCIASPQAEGALLAYAAIPFVVTASGGLPNTGYNPWLPGTLGLGLLLAGGGLVLITRRRRTAAGRLPGAGSTRT